MWLGMHDKGNYRAYQGLWAVSGPLSSSQGFPGFDSAGAGGWLCPVGASMANKRPPGGEGLSHSPADGGVITLWKQCFCLRSSTIGGRGPFCRQGYVRRSEDRLSEPQSRRLAEAGLARHPVGCGRCGALRGHGASSPVRSAENLSSR